MAAAAVRAKLVMLGAPGVGKTSLVRRYVHSVFSDEHLSTLGVKVDRKIVQTPDHTVTMLLWDVHGETEGLTVPKSYLGGVAAALLVVDGTRPETIETVAVLHERLLETSPNALTTLIGNKADLEPDYSGIDAAGVDLGIGPAMPVSAKSGAGVEEMFGAIALSLTNR